MTLGGEIDYHTPIGTGNVINIDKHPSDICLLLPTQFIAVDRGCCENWQALVLELHIAGYLGLAQDELYWCNCQL
jgi:hypothetical protein